jgi:hypothetical protein
VQKIEGYYGQAYGNAEPSEPHFSFLRGDAENTGVVTSIIGE